MNIMNGNNRAQRLIKSWGRVLADSLTLSRLLLAPVFLSLHGKEAFGLCFLTMLGIGLSDILDGLVARKLGSPAVYGAALDAGVDFAVLFTLSVYYFLSGIYPLFYSCSF
jgi:phosphatidylglycerophosphate synthase